MTDWLPLTYCTTMVDSSFSLTFSLRAPRAGMERIMNIQIAIPTKVVSTFPTPRLESALCLLPLKLVGQPDQIRH